MPRDATGLYTLVAGNPVIKGDPVLASWANPTLDDISIALTESLDRYGNGPMMAPLVTPSLVLQKPASGSTLVGDVSMALTGDTLKFQAGTDAVQQLLYNIVTGELQRTNSPHFNLTYVGSQIKVKRVGGNAGFSVDVDNTRIAHFQMLTNGLARWQIQKGTANETGSNAGSDFEIERYTDAGALLGTPLTINRSTGNATFSGTVTAPTIIATSAINAPSLISVTNTNAPAGDQVGHMSVSSSGSLSFAGHNGTAFDRGFVISTAGVITNQANGATMVDTSGAAFTGDISVVKSTAASISLQSTSGEGRFIARAPAGQYADIWFQAGLLHRWLIGRDSGAESGSNAGSDFVIRRYDDAGAFVGYPFSISRATGDATFSNTVIAPAVTVNGSGNQLTVSRNATQYLTIRNSGTMTSPAVTSFSDPTVAKQLNFVCTTDPAHTAPSAGTLGFLFTVLDKAVFNIVTNGDMGFIGNNYAYTPASGAVQSRWSAAGSPTYSRSAVVKHDTNGDVYWGSLTNDHVTINRGIKIDSTHALTNIFTGGTLVDTKGATFTGLVTASSGLTSSSVLSVGNLTNAPAGIGGGDMLLVGPPTATGNAGIEVIAGANTATSYMHFADPDARDVGGFQYLHGTDTLSIRVGGAGRYTLTSTVFNLLNAGSTLQVGGIQVIGPRQTGWTAFSGSIVANKAAYAPAASYTTSATYVQAEASAVAAAVAAANARMRAMEDALRAHGLIN